MEAQIYNAIIAGIIVVIGGLATFIIALFRWIPQRMTTQLEEFKANEATRREVAKDKSDTIRENEHAESRLKLATAAMLESQANMWKNILEEFRETRSTTDAHTIAVSNNTQTVGAHGRQITGLTEAVGELRQEVEETGKKINIVLDKLPDPLKAAQIEGSIATLTDIARNVTAAQVDLNLLLNKANDLLIKLAMKKTDSQPLPVITPHMLDSASDGKPTTAPP